MRIKVFDHKDGWILGKVSLLEYIQSLTKENFNYKIQRGIVINQYLDTILDAVDKGNPLPPISLVSKDKAVITGDGVINNFNILDGLQRTYRLWIYYRLAEIAERDGTFDYKEVTKKLKEEETSYSVAVSPRQVRKLFKSESPINVNNLKDKYSEYDLYIYLWQNLDVKEEIRLMLILNAGQKRMQLTHQYELMYMRLFDDYTEENGQIEVRRSKDGKIRDKERQVGQYNVATVIIGMQSLILAKPIRLSSELLYKKATNEDIEGIPEGTVESFFTEKFIHNYLQLLYDLDNKLCKHDAEVREWFAKDTTISGIMAGIGQTRWWGDPTEESVIKNLKESVDKIQNANDFNLGKYQEAYDGVTSRKFNVGMVVRKAIAFYTSNLLTEKKVSWKDAFNFAMKG